MVSEVQLVGGAVAASDLVQIRVPAAGDGPPIGLLLHGHLSRVGPLSGEMPCMRLQ